MSNLARDFQNTVVRKQLEAVTAVTEKNFKELKEVTLILYDQNLALKDMLEKLMKESLVGYISTN